MNNKLNNIVYIFNLPIYIFIFYNSEDYLFKYIIILFHCDIEIIIL